MTPTRDLEFERTLATMIPWMKARGLEAHTTKGQSLIFRPRRRRRSKLTGMPR